MMIDENARKLEEADWQRACSLYPWPNGGPNAPRHLMRVLCEDGEFRLSLKNVTSFGTTVLKPAVLPSSLLCSNTHPATVEHFKAACVRPFPAAPGICSVCLVLLCCQELVCSPLCCRAHKGLADLSIPTETPNYGNKTPLRFSRPLCCSTLKTPLHSLAISK